MSADDPGSITRWLDRLKAGHPDAADAIWHRYYQRVVSVARIRLQNQSVADGEDLAQDAFLGFYAGAVQGQFDRLRDRTELWNLLMTIVVKKVREHRRWLGRQKRNGSMDRARSSASDPKEDIPDDELLALIIDKEPPPEFKVILHDQVQELLNSLPDAIHRQIAEWRIAGVSNVEIARNLGCAVRTVERKVQNIHIAWEEISVESDP